MNNNQLINKSYWILQRDKIILKSFDEEFVINVIAKRIFEALNTILIDFDICLEIGSRNNLLIKLIKNKYTKINYLQSDISYKLLNHLNSKCQKICFDHDCWPLKNSSLDLVISNFYLHWSDNFELILQNILKSLKNNGFFICSLPGSNTMHELKKSMMLADIECYDGVNKRFSNFLPLNSFIDKIYKIGFKIPLIELDNLTFNYNNFNDLLKDVKLLFETNMLVDRKQLFEKKDYFKIVEKHYREKFTVKGKLPVTYEIIYLSGWKNDNSQQKPLQPGQAKYSLKEVLK